MMIANSIQAAGLTTKQRAVLDLLIEHKTSKEIARELDISPHTVDQRINFAKDKLGARTRGEVAVLYRRLVEVYERPAYDESHLPQHPSAGEERAGPQGSLPVPGFVASSRAAVPGPEANFSVVPDMFDGRYGTFVRSGAIFAIAAMMAICVLGGLAIYAQLSVLLRA